MDTIRKAILRAIIYARVSTDEQSDSGFGLDVQVDHCRQYAESMGWTVVRELREDFTGRAPFNERPEGKKVTAMLAQKQAEVILFDRPDRIARRVVVGLTFVSIWTDAGIKVWTVSDGEIKSDSDLISLIKFWEVDADWTKIVKNLKDGRYQKVRAGKVLGVNRAPYGYRFTRDENGKVVGLDICEEAASVVRLVFQWYLDDKLPMREIARKLQAMGIATPGQDAYKNRGSRGIWNHATVSNILFDESYAGVWQYGKRTGKARQLMPVSERVCVEVPQIVDRETWNKARAQRTHNKRFATRNAKHDYLLRGLIKCGCGRGMTGRCSGKSYICAARSYNQATCHEPSFSAEWFEGQIWQELRGFFQDLRRLKRELKAAQQQELEQQEPKREELEAVQANIKQAERDADEIAAVLPQARGRVKESLDVRMDEVNARYEALTQRRTEIEAELQANGKLTDEAIEDILTYARDVKRGIENATLGDRRRVFELLRVGITVKEGKYAAHCVLGEWDGEIVNGRQPKSNSPVKGISQETHRAAAHSLQ